MPIATTSRTASRLSCSTASTRRPCGTISSMGSSGAPTAGFTDGTEFSPRRWSASQLHWDTVQGWGHIPIRGVSPTTAKAGGGHAHSGLMISLGGNWPAEYRNTVFTVNFHGRRLNNDRLEREGAGYVAHHAADF